MPEFMRLPRRGRCSLGYFSLKSSLAKKVNDKFDTRLGINGFLDRAVRNELDRIQKGDSDE